MSALRFSGKSSIAALAAALALTLLGTPALARPVDGDGERTRGAWNRPAQAEARGRAEGESPRGWSRPAAVPDRPAPRAAEPRPEWRSRSSEARPSVQVTPPAERQWRGRGGQGTVQTGDATPRFEGRNRSYSDPDRNRAYRDTRREHDGDRHDWRRERRDERVDRGTTLRHDGDRRRESWRNAQRDGRDWRNDHERRDDWRRDGRDRYDRHGYNGQHRRWDNGWRNDRRYDWSRHRNAHRHVYRLGNYHAPYRGYYYRPLSIGFTLDSLFFSSRYWINDPWQYRLPAAYGPYRWVRYYDDALLVDIYDGQVVDVIRDFFW